MVYGVLPIVLRGSTISQNCSQPQPKTFKYGQVCHSQSQIANRKSRVLNCCSKEKEQINVLREPLVWRCCLQHQVVNLRFFSSLCKHLPLLCFSSAVIPFVLEPRTNITNQTSSCKIRIELSFGHRPAELLL